MNKNKTAETKKIINTNEKIFIYKTIFILFLFTIIILNNINISTAQIEFEELIAECAPINNTVREQYVINYAIDCEMNITNEQFTIADDEHKIKYVLSENINLSDDAQFKLFTDLFLTNEKQIQEYSDLIKNFFEHYETYNNDTLQLLFEKTANDAIQILNEKKEFFLKYFNEKVTFLNINEHANILSYDNDTKIFIIENSNIIFTLSYLQTLETRGFSEFFIDAQGNLKANLYKNTTICDDCDYYMSSDGEKIVIKSGNFVLDEYSFSSANPFEINIENTSRTIKGRNIIGIKNSEKIFEVNGEIHIKTEDAYLLGDNTEFTYFEENQRQYKLNTKEELEINIKKQPINFQDNCVDPEVCYLMQPEEVLIENYCQGKNNCIQINNANKEITLNLDDNQVLFEDYTKSIIHINAENITGVDSQFLYQNTDVTWKFDNSESPLSFKGNPTLGPTITYNGEFETGHHQITWDGAAIQMCSQCTTTGYYNSEKPTGKLPAKPEKINGITVITTNPHSWWAPAAEKYDGRGVEKGVKQSLPNHNYYSSTYLNPQRSGDRCVNPDCRFDFEKIKSSPNQNNNILIITGHHYSGAKEVWGFMGDKINYDNLPTDPNILIVMFSACHSVQDPQILAKYSNRQDRLSAEQFIELFSEKYPNLRLVIGYDSKAPGNDIIFENPLRKAEGSDAGYIRSKLTNPGGEGLSNIRLLERSGFKTLGELGTKLYKQEEIIVGYYYLTEEGDWYYYNRYTEQNGMKLQLPNMLAQRNRESNQLDQWPRQINWGNIENIENALIPFR